jgi:hypothetical protein
MANLNPMVYVKLVCQQCNQKYAFDVLPVNNQMPVTVKCPVCRVDGTPAANLFLAQKLMGISPQPPDPPVPSVQSVPTVVNVTSVYSVPSVPSIPSLPAVGVISANKAADDEWRRRALEAEARAEQAQAALKASLAPQLAESLKEAVVQGLAAQRSELLKAQHSAALEISELVQRLDELKAPMQDRLRSYEDRIHELEKNLAERNEENRELLKLKIEMTRRQLEVERARSRVDFN